MVISYKPVIKNTLKIFFVAVFLGCTLAIFLYELSGDLYFSFPVMAFCVYGFLHVSSMKIHLGNSEVIWEDCLYKKTIKYDDVIKVRYLNRVFEIETSRKRIKITTDIDNREMAVEYIINKLKQKNENLTIQEDEKSYDYF